MLDNVKALLIGAIGGLKWYGRRIRESKWYIIPFVIDVILVPLKLIIIAIVCINKNGRAKVINFWEEILEDEED